MRRGRTVIIGLCAVFAAFVHGGLSNTATANCQPCPANSQYQGCDESRSGNTTTYTTRCTCNPGYAPQGNYCVSSGGYGSPSNSAPTYSSSSELRRYDNRRVDADDEYFQVRGGTREICEQICLNDRRCRVAEWHYSTSDQVWKCNLYDHVTIDSGRSGDTHLSIKE